MENVYLYASAFLRHWWPLVSTGSILGFEEFSERYWTWASNYLKKIHENKRGIIKVCALLFASFLSGYFARNDEHSALIAANNELTKISNQLNDAQRRLEEVSATQAEPRMAFSRIEIVKVLPVFNGWVGEQDVITKLWLCNAGQSAAKPLSFNVFPFLSDKVLSTDEEENYMGYVKNKANAYQPVNEVQAGDTASYLPHNGFMADTWNGFEQKKKYLYLFSSLSYLSEISQKSITSEICLYFSNNNLNDWSYCTSGHNKITRGN